MSDMRAALSAARDAGDITLMEYLAELRKLREEGAASSAQAAGSSAAPTAGDTAPPNSAARAASDSGSVSDSELVGEDGAPYKRARVALTRARVFSYEADVRRPADQHIESAHSLMRFVLLSCFVTTTEWLADDDARSDDGRSLTETWSETRVIGDTCVSRVLRLCIVCV